MTKNPTPYDDFLFRLQQQAVAIFDQIMAAYNFDSGDEFEVAVCKFLRQVLPKKYSICRGHIVTIDGERSQGDDIIIYDNHLLPTARVISEDNYSVKNRIPVEAVYAYIEAKHTLNKENYKKALFQINEVKRIIAKRKEVKPSEILHGLNLRAGENTNIDFNTPEGYPTIMNPLYCAIIARKIEEQINFEITFAKQFLGLDTSFSYKPDIILAGDFISFPAYKNPIDPNNRILKSPFYSPKSELEKRDIDYLVLHKKNQAITMFIMRLLEALNYIKLGKMDYTRLFKYLVDNEITSS